MALVTKRNFEVNKDINVPRHSTLYKYRVDLDLCSMLFARKFRFPVHLSWYCHLRLDSSPQFNKDYLMSECDIFYAGDGEVSEWSDISRDGVLLTRLLVGHMVGARSAGTIFKAKKLLNALTLDPWRITVNIVNIDREYQRVHALPPRKVKTS